MPDQSEQTAALAGSSSSSMLALRMAAARALARRLAATIAGEVDSFLESLKGRADAERKELAVAQAMHAHSSRRRKERPFCQRYGPLMCMCAAVPLVMADVGFATYVALVRQDHRYNNPVCIVFFQLLEQRLQDFRRQNARRKVVKNLRLMLRLHLAVRALRARLCVLRFAVGGEPRSITCI